MASIGYYVSCAFVVVLAFTGARASTVYGFYPDEIQSFRIFITKMDAQRLQRAMLHGQYWVFKMVNNKNAFNRSQDPLSSSLMYPGCD